MIERGSTSCSIARRENQSSIPIDASTAPRIASVTAKNARPPMTIRCYEDAGDAPIRDSTQSGGWGRRRSLRLADAAGDVALLLRVGLRHRLGDLALRVAARLLVELVAAGNDDHRLRTRRRA